MRKLEQKYAKELAVVGVHSAKFPNEKGTDNLRNAVQRYELQHPVAIDGERIGITGFCMGGRVAWLMAAVNPAFKAVVPYYGGNIMSPWGAATQSPFDLTAGINCPMMFHFGREDGNPSPDDQVKLDAELTRLGKTHQFYSYPGAGHAFMDHTNPDRYHKEAAG